jgi:signal peptidase II
MEPIALSRDPFSPCGRRWRAAPDEGSLSRYGTWAGTVTGAVRTTALLSLFWGVSAFALDRLHKFWQIDVQGWRGGEIVPVTGFFDYVLVWNTGISYGLFGDMPIFVLGGVIVVAILALAFWWWKATHPLVQIGLMFCIGGALSNAVDRLVYGAVADFFHFHWQQYSFYIFNIADVAISFGVLLLILDLLGFGRPRPVTDVT